MNFDYPTPRARRKLRLAQLSKFNNYRRRFGKRSEFIDMCHQAEAEAQKKRKSQDE